MHQNVIEVKSSSESINDVSGRQTDQINQTDSNGKQTENSGKQQQATGNSVHLTLSAVRTSIHKNIFQLPPETTKLSQLSSLLFFFDTVAMNDTIITQSATEFSNGSRILQTFVFPVIVEFAGTLYAQGDCLDWLDVGCGVGNISSLIARSFANVNSLHAFDINPDMLNLANRFNSDPRIKYSLGNMIEIATYPKGLKFDVATSFLSLQFSPDVNLTLKNICEVLNPRGILFGQTTSSPNPAVTCMEHWFKTESKWLPYYKSEPFMSLPMMPSGVWSNGNPTVTFENILRSSGFTDIHVKLTSARVPFNKDELKGQCLSFAQKYIDCLPASEKAPCIEEAFNIYFAAYNSEQIGTHYQAIIEDHLLTFFARKA